MITAETVAIIAVVAVRFHGPHEPIRVTPEQTAEYLPPFVVHIAHCEVRPDRGAQAAAVRPGQRMFLEIRHRTFNDWIVPRHAGGQKSERHQGRDASGVDAAPFSREAPRVGGGLGSLGGLELLDQPRDDRIDFRVGAGHRVGKYRNRFESR